MFCCVWWVFCWSNWCWLYGLGLGCWVVVCLVVIGWRLGIFWLFSGWCCGFVWVLWLCFCCLLIFICWCVVFLIWNVVWDWGCILFCVLIICMWLVCLCWVGLLVVVWVLDRCFWCVFIVIVWMVLKFVGWWLSVWVWWMGCCVLWDVWDWILELVFLGFGCVWWGLCMFCFNR